MVGLLSLAGVAASFHTFHVWETSHARNRSLLGGQLNTGYKLWPRINIKQRILIYRVHPREAQQGGKLSFSPAGTNDGYVPCQDLA